MSSDFLSLACAILPTAYGFFQIHLGSQKAKVETEFDGYLNLPQLTPTQAAFKKSAQLKNRVITGLFILTFTAITILTAVDQSVMLWSTIPVANPSNLYNNLRVAGLMWTLAAYSVIYLTHRAYLNRMDYLRKYYEKPEERRIPRSQESDLAILNAGVYEYCRDPENLAFHWYAVGLLLFSQSWLMAILVVIIFFLAEFSVVMKDARWTVLFGEVYNLYRERKGGQSFFRCCNSIEENLQKSIKQNMADLAAKDNANNNV